MSLRRKAKAQGSERVFHKKTFTLALCVLATLTGVRAAAVEANDVPVCHVDAAGRI